MSYATEEMSKATASMDDLTADTLRLQFLVKFLELSPEKRGEACRFMDELKDERLQNESPLTSSPTKEPM